LPLLLKTFAAENRPSLRWLERNGGVLPTLGTCGAGFGFGGRLSWNRRPQNGNAFCFTGLATFWLVFELLVVKEKLFARGKNKVRTAVDTLENLVLEFHPSPHSPPTSRSFKKARGSPHARVRAESLRTPPQTCHPRFGPPADHRGALHKEAPENNSAESSTFRKTTRRGKRNGPPPAQGCDPLGCQSCSLRAFLRLRLRANASLTRFFSPGFR
jgi:hypothetical protein